MLEMRFLAEISKSKFHEKFGEDDTKKIVCLIYFTGSKKKFYFSSSIKNKKFTYQGTSMHVFFYKKRFCFFFAKGLNLANWKFDEYLIW